MVDIANLKRAHKIAAKIVAKFGDQYLPIFCRINEELKSTESNANLKSLALQLSQTENFI